MAKKTSSIIPDIIDIEAINSFYYNTFLELDTNRFRWKNLPDSIDPRYLELFLCRNGAVVFLRDPITEEYAAFMCTWTGFDDYYNPTDFYVILPTGKQISLDSENAVIIWNNFTRTSDIPAINMYSTTIADIYVSALVNARAQKHPVAMVAENEQQKLTMINAYKNYAGNHPVIFVKDKQTVANNFTTVNTGAPFVVQELLDAKDRIMEEFLKWLGVKVPLSNNRERLIVNEQIDANAVTYQLRNRGLHSRQIAAEQINKMFGLNIEVEFNEELSTKVTEAVDTMGMVKEGWGGIINESIHNSG